MEIIIIAAFITLLGGGLFFYLKYMQMDDPIAKSDIGAGGIPDTVEQKSDEPHITEREPRLTPRNTIGVLDFFATTFEFVQRGLEYIPKWFYLIGKIVTGKSIEDDLTEKERTVASLRRKFLNQRSLLPNPYITFEQWLNEEAEKVSTLNDTGNYRRNDMGTSKYERPIDTTQQEYDELYNDRDDIDNIWGDDGKEIQKIWDVMYADYGYEIHKTLEWRYNPLRKKNMYHFSVIRPTKEQKERARRTRLKMANPYNGYGTRINQLDKLVNGTKYAENANRDSFLRKYEDHINDLEKLTKRK